MAQLTVPVVIDHDDLQRMVDEKIAEVKAQFIPKAEYENRLKADMVAMLTEIQTDIEEVPKYCMTHDATFVYRKAEEYISDINNLIQQKIDKLRGEEK